jgi:hypothetical protein
MKSKLKRGHWHSQSSTRNRLSTKPHEYNRAMVAKVVKTIHTIIKASASLLRLDGLSKFDSSPFGGLDEGPLRNACKAEGGIPFFMLR